MQWAFRAAGISQDRLISIDELVDIVADLAGKRLRESASKIWKARAAATAGRAATPPPGLREVLGWEPRVSPQEGPRARLPHWIRSRLVEVAGGRLSPGAAESTVQVSHAGQAFGQEAGPKKTGAEPTAVRC